MIILFFFLVFAVFFGFGFAFNWLWFIAIFFFVFWVIGLLLGRREPETKHSFYRW